MWSDQEIVEAAGVLEKISQTPEQRVLCNARLKIQRDEESRIRRARQEGIQDGRKNGMIVGRVLHFQQLLGIRQAQRTCDLTRVFNKARSTKNL